MKNQLAINPGPDRNETDDSQYPKTKIDCSDVTTESIHRRAETVTVTLYEILHHARTSGELMNSRGI